MLRCPIRVSQLATRKRGPFHAPRQPSHARCGTLGRLCLIAFAWSAAWVARFPARSCLHYSAGFRPKFRGSWRRATRDSWNFKRRNWTRDTNSPAQNHAERSIRPMALGSVGAKRNPLPVVLQRPPAETHRRLNRTGPLSFGHTHLRTFVSNFSSLISKENRRVCEVTRVLTRIPDRKNGPREPLWAHPVLPICGGATAT
jgi:hypothetical protein